MKYTKNLLSVFLPLFIYGCEEKEQADFDFRKIADVPAPVLQTWAKAQWVMLVPIEAKGEAYRIIGTYSPLNKSITKIKDVDGTLNSISLGRTLQVLAYSYRVDQRSSAPNILKLVSKVEKKEKEIYKCQFPDVIHSLSWSPHERYLAFLVGPFGADRTDIWSNQMLLVLDNRTGKIKSYGKIDCWGSHNIIGNPQLVSCQLVWSENSEHIYYASTGNLLYRLALQDGHCSKIGKGCIPVMEKSGRMLVWNNKPFELQEIELSSGKVRKIFSIKSLQAIGNSVVSPDGKYVGFLCYEKRVHLPQMLVWNEVEGIIGLVPTFRPVFGWFCDTGNLKSVFSQ